MAKQTFSGISLKAATITGAIVGFLCWLLVIPYSFSGYGMTGYYGGYGMMNYGTMGYMMGNVFHNATFVYMMNGQFYPYNRTGYYPATVFHSYSIVSIIIDIVVGALAGFVIAAVYNWALKFK